MKVALHGATGRMGRTLARLCADTTDLEVVGAAAAASDPNIGRDIGELAGVLTTGVAVSSDIDAALLGADVAIDFSLPVATNAFLAAIARAKIPFVMGTTGLSKDQEARLAEVGKVVPFVWSRNTSLGVQVLAELVRAAVSRLGPSFDVEITEVHHRKKVDAPSGTALRLADAVIEARADAQLLHGREGQVGARTDSEVGVFGLRGGDVIGDHTVHLLGAGERLELTHRATSRDVFGYGALRAARWVVGKAPGGYAIADVLGE